MKPPKTYLSKNGSSAKREALISLLLMNSIKIRRIASSRQTLVPKGDVPIALL